MRRIRLLFLSLVMTVLIAATSPRPTAADGGWQAEYYTNPDLAGFPATTWTDAYIGFEWGNGPPRPGLYIDDFSIRWTKSEYVGYTTAFRFCAMADDGVRIYFDGAIVLDEWHGNNGIAFCGNPVRATRGTHRLTVEYYEDGGKALIYVWWDEVELPTTPVAVPTPRPTPPTPTPSPGGDTTPAPFEGWYGEYFGNRNMSGNPDIIRLDPWIGFNWGVGSFADGGRVDHFSVRWTRSVRFESEGRYRFCVMTDDGVRLWIDNTLLIDEWHANNGITYCATHIVNKNTTYRIRVEYFEAERDALIYVWWERAVPYRWQ